MKRPLTEPLVKSSSLNCHFWINITAFSVTIIAKKEFHVRLDQYLFSTCLWSSHSEVRLTTTPSVWCIFLATSDREWFVLHAQHPQQVYSVYCQSLWVVPWIYQSQMFYVSGPGWTGPLALSSVCVILNHDPLYIQKTASNFGSWCCKSSTISRYITIWSGWV